MKKERKKLLSEEEKLKKSLKRYFETKKNYFLGLLLY